MWELSWILVGHQLALEDYLSVWKLPPPPNTHVLTLGAELRRASLRSSWPSIHHGGCMASNIMSSHNNIQNQKGRDWLFLTHHSPVFQIQAQTLQVKGWPGVTFLLVSVKEDWGKVVSGILASACQSLQKEGYWLFSSCPFGFILCPFLPFSLPHALGGWFSTDFTTRLFPLAFDGVQPRGGPGGVGREQERRWGIYSLCSDPAGPQFVRVCVSLLEDQVRKIMLLVTLRGTVLPFLLKSTVHVASIFSFCFLFWKFPNLLKT